MNPSWKVNTPALLKEILGNNEAAMLRVPLTIFGNLLGEVGARCAEIDDPILNGLMAQLAIYEVADPYSPNYNKELANHLIEHKQMLAACPVTPSGVSGARRRMGGKQKKALARLHSAGGA